MENLNEFLKEQGLKMECYQSLEKCKKSVGWLLYTSIKNAIDKKLSQQIELSEKDIRFLNYGIDISTYDDTDGLVAAIDEYNMDNPDAFIISTATHEQLLEYITLRYVISESSIMLDNLCKDVHKQSTLPGHQR